MSITQLYAFVGADPDEGIVAFGDSPERMMPLVCASESTMKIMRPAAEQIARKTGKNIRILKFTQCEEIGEIHA